MSDGAKAVTDLLHAWAGGDLRARDELVPLVYHELRKRASGYLRRERPDHTLQATALVHEAFLRLAGQDRIAWQNRGQFYAIAAQMMRRILVDHARQRQASKRPAAGMRVDLGENIAAPEPTAYDVLLLDEALTDLAALDPRQGRIVELRVLWRFVRAGGGRRDGRLARHCYPRVEARPCLALPPDDRDADGRTSLNRDPE